MSRVHDGRRILSAPCVRRRGATVDSESVRFGCRSVFGFGLDFRESTARDGVAAAGGECLRIVAVWPVAPWLAIPVGKAGQSQE